MLKCCGSFHVVEQKSITSNRSLDNKSSEGSGRVPTFQSIFHSKTSKVMTSYINSKLIGIIYCSFSETFHIAKRARLLTGRFIN